MGLAKYSFSKAEKLTGKKRIEGLFKTGSSFYLSDFQVRHLLSQEEVKHHRILISVPKRYFKRAVDRNLIKRRIREAYRLNKGLVEHKATLYIGFIYLSKQILTFHEIQDQLIRILSRLGNNNADRNEQKT